jgi:hypothetical protein
LAYSSSLKMELACSSRTPGDFQQTTWCYIAEDRIVVYNLSLCEELQASCTLSTTYIRY